MTVIRHIFTVIYFLFSVTVCAQESVLNFKNYLINDGLPSSQIYEIIEDHDGYIWFGTDAGLVRYNGYEFKTYTTEDGLSTNVIFKLCVDEENRIWCIGDDWRINRVSNNDIILTHKVLDIETFKAGIRIERQSLKYLSNQLLLDFSVLSPYNYQNDEFGEKFYSSISYDLEKGIELNHGPVKSGIYIEKDSLGCRISMQIDSNMVVYYNGLPIDEFQNYSFSRSKGYVNVLELNNTIYYTVLGYIFMIQADNDSCQVTEVWKSDYRIWDFKKDKYGNVYLATNKGVCKFENGNWNNENWISDNISISNIHFDRKGGLWMASLYKGLFYSCNSHVKCVFSPSNASINEIHGTRRDVFYSNDNSEVYEIKNHRVNKLKRNDKFFLSLLNPLSSKKVFELRSSGKGYWFTSYSGTKNVLLNYESRSYYNSDFTSKNHYYNDSTIIYNIGSLIFVMNKDGNNIESTSVDHSFIKLTPLVESFRLASTSIGIRKYFHPKLDFNEKVKRSIKVSDLEPYRPENPFFRLNIPDILLLNDSIIIFASKEQGCLFENKKSGDEYLTKGDGLISNSIHKLYANQGYIVFLSKQGISVTKDCLNFTNYNNKNGLISNDVRDAFIRNDSIWVAMDKGICYFPLEKKLKDIPVQLYLTHTIVDTTSVVSPNDTLNLEYWQKNLSLSFEAISFEQEGEINYSYMLEGLDKSWGHTDNRTVRYPNMPSGSFNFWVKYQYSDNSWSKPILLLHISKSKPYWERLWFFILSGFSIILITIGLAYLFYRRYDRIQQEKLNVLNLERKNLQAQMNPHFTFNTINSIQHFILNNNKKDAIVYLSEFANLMRKTLDYNYTEYISIDEELVFLTHYLSLENKRFDQNFIIEVSGDDNLDLASIYIPSLLLQPLVENVIMHSNYQEDQRRLIRVEIIEKGTFLVLRIIDFGQGKKGEPNQRKHKSRGLNIVQSRIKIYNGNRYSESDFQSYFTDEEKKTGHTVQLKLYTK